MRTYTAAGYFDITLDAAEPEYRRGTVRLIVTASGNARQRRRQIRRWKAQGYRVWQHRATGAWSSTVTNKER